MYRVNEVSKRLKLSISTVYELVKTGRLPSYKFGGSVRISEEDLERYMENCRVGPTERPRKASPIDHVSAVRSKGTQKGTHFKNLNGERLRKAWG